MTRIPVDMEGEEPLKPRRPLPRSPAELPGNTVSPSQFYGTASSSTTASSSKPPPLPTRTQNPGSARTVYHPPSSPPPSYARAETSPFREPELIIEEPVSSMNDNIPDLIPQEASWYPPNTFEAQADWAGSGGPTWDGNANPWQPVPGEWPTDGYDATGYTTGAYASRIVDIDGRDLDEETAWWNAEVRDARMRPGPGILPPVLTDLLHDSEHSLLSVIVTPPDIRPREPRVDPSAAPSDAPQPQPPPPPPPAAAPPPSDDEVHTAIPHPHAYYCRRHNGWVIVAWKSSLVLPPLAKSFLKNNARPSHDQARRKKRLSCVGHGDQPSSQANKTHHFHVYEKAVDAHKLNPPFHRSGWEKEVKIKAKRRKATISLDEVDLMRLKNLEEQVLQDEEDEGDLLDLYICCQCSMYCVASEVIPGVIPIKYVEEFTREKLNNPQPGRTGQMAVALGWDTFLKMIEHRLWKGETRPLPIASNNFQAKLGWGPIIDKIFGVLGYEIRPVSTEDRRLALDAPTLDPNTPEGRQYRSKLLRAWVEISVWLSEYVRLNAKGLAGLQVPKGRLWVKVEGVREVYQRAFGAHHEQLPRGNLPDGLDSYQPISEAWQALGLTPSTYTWDLLAFAYLAQCRCDPANTVRYFTHLFSIVSAMQEIGGLPPQELQALIMEERSRGRYTFDDSWAASRTLGFGQDGHLGLDFEDDIEDEFVANAWRDAVRWAWRDPDNGSALLRDAHEAFRMLAEARGSAKLRQMWESGCAKMLTPERAYDVLEIPKDTDESMLLTVFSLRVQEQPAQVERWREALSIIAEVRDSLRLRQFLVTGTDPGDVVAPTPQDLPRGLNQLGNTCYLNSLLQYFYTIRELRDAVAPMAHSDVKVVEDGKLTDDDLKRHRVGGRLVTRREIARSRKFVSHLADLFWQMEYCETAAVTPALELAKLALVTSKDEEEDEADKGGTDSSNDTDATLVEDGSSRFPIPESSDSAQSLSSVLGKRPRDTPSAMEVDSPLVESPQEKDGFMIVSQPNAPSRSDTPPPPLEQAGPSTRNRVTTPLDGDGDAVMSDARVEEGPSQKAPSVPARKAEVSDSVMMFGRQHDVSECMDNCMFQIETALLKFDEMSGSQNGKTSVVKRLFYGKIRQRISLVSANLQTTSSIHEKEDLFSHLPVNVSEDGMDLYDGLSRYVDDVVEFEGKKARMEVSLVELPPLLQIQLQRVQFNRETLQPYKSQAYVKFGETIFMDRFLDTADPQKKSRSKVIQAELNACQDRINILTRGNHAPFDGCLAKTHEFLCREEPLGLPEVDEEFTSHLNHEQGFVKTELEDLRARAVNLKEELEGIWRDETAAAYELTSVFVHRGSSPSWGHYFFYSRHLPGNPDSWFKYNDSDVTKVSKDEVLADTTGSTANPYLLVFARKGLEVVDTVKRGDITAMEETGEMK